MALPCASTLRLQQLCTASGLHAAVLLDQALLCWCERWLTLSSIGGMHPDRTGLVANGSQDAAPTSSSDWSALPVGFIGMVLERLDKPVKGVARRVCRAWEFNITGMLQDVTLRLPALRQWCGSAPAAGAAHLWARMPSLTSLDLRHELLPNGNGGDMASALRDAALLLPSASLPMLTKLQLTTCWQDRVELGRGSSRELQPPMHAVPEACLRDAQLLLLLARLPQLTTLSVPRSKITGGGLADALAAGLLSAITTLDMSGVGLSAADLVILGQLPALARLNFAGNGPLLHSGDLAGLLSQASTLCWLSLAGCRLSDQAAAGLEALTSLTYLDISDTAPAPRRQLHGYVGAGAGAGGQAVRRGGGWPLSDTGLAHLAGLTLLQELRLAEQDNLTCNGLALLAPLSASLTALDLSACAWTLLTEGLSQLGNLFPSLTTLDISGAEDDIVSMPGTALASLAALPKLSRLVLRHQFDLTADDLSELAQLPCLTSVDLTGSFLVDDALEALGCLTGLVHLGLGTSLDPAEQRRPSILEPLSALSCLTSLDLRGNSLGALQLGALAPLLPRLRELLLNDNTRAWDVGGGQMATTTEARALVQDSLDVWRTVRAR